MSAEGLLVGALVRAVITCNDAGWTEDARRRLLESAAIAESSLRRIAARMEVVKRSPAPAPWVSEQVAPDVARYAQSIHESLVRRGARLKSATVAYGDVILTSERLDGSTRCVRLKSVLDDTWAETPAGTIVGRSDVVGRLAAGCRFRLSATTRVCQHRGDEDPHAVPEGAARRGRRAAPKAAARPPSDRPR